MLNVRIRASLIGLALLFTVSTSAWAQAPTLAATTAGNSVTLTWTAVPNATNYYLEYAVQGGAAFPGVLVGDGTTVTVPGVPFGIYLARITAVVNNAAGPVSNIATIVVSPGPPAAPSGLSAAINGRDVLLSWGLPAGATGLQLHAGSTPGASDIAAMPLAPSTSLGFAGLPAGKYFVRLMAASAYGVSPSSNELEMNLPGCIAPATVPLSHSSAGGFVTVSWPAVPGAAGYRLDVSSTPGGSPNLLSQVYGPGTTRITTSGIPDAKYYVTLHVTLGCGATGSSGEQVLDVKANGSGPRTPDPAPGTRLPLPGYGSSVANSMAGQYPGDLRNSCHEFGGNNVWLYRLVQRLRQTDSRWGLNWKRGNYGDMSQDIVTYHYGSGPDEGSRDVYIIDTISGHCGGSPGPNWADVTQATRDGNTIGIWTLQPFLAAGFQP
jgi:hypothetical protein